MLRDSVGIHYRHLYRFSFERIIEIYFIKSPSETKYIPLVRCVITWQIQSVMAFYFQMAAGNTTHSLWVWVWHRL